jgi:hypothetical protein
MGSHGCEAAAEVIYTHLFKLGLKLRPWEELDASQRGGWMVVARDAIYAYHVAREQTP